MERRLEQTVQGRTTGAKRALYAGAYVLLVLLVIGMLVSAAGILGETEAGKPAIGWPSLILFLLLTALAICVWLGKDRLRMEYDYVLQDGTLVVFAILNGRRRKRRLQLPLASVTDCGPEDETNCKADVRRHRLYLNADARRYYLCYGVNGARHMALLELNVELADAVRTAQELPAGAWRENKGETKQYGSLS